MKVLVVDDSKTRLRIIGNVVGQLGHEHDTALDGVKALALYTKNNNYDVILTDWNMPNMNGLELVKKIREINKKIPIVMITTEGGKGEVITALKAGVNNYVVKPFNAETLKDKLSNVMK